MRRPLYSSVFTSMLFAALAAACGDGDAPATDTTADAAAEVEDLTGRSVYRMTLTQGEDSIELDRDLTGEGQYFAFGSTHIAPAVSFAVTDSVTFPRTMTINLNFGIVVASDAHPIQTGDAGTYTFGELPPAIDVFYRGLQYRSSLEGAAGSVVVTSWSVEPGDAFAGTFSGTLMAEGPSGQTLAVEGEFRFTLPERQ